MCINKTCEYSTNKDFNGKMLELNLMFCDVRQRDKRRKPFSTQFS